MFTSTCVRSKVCPHFAGAAGDPNPSEPYPPGWFSIVSVDVQMTCEKPGQTKSLTQHNSLEASEAERGAALQLGKRGLWVLWDKTQTTLEKHTLRRLRETECVLKSQLHELCPKAGTSARTGSVPGSWYETACITFTRTKHGHGDRGASGLSTDPKVSFGAGKRKGGLKGV